MTWSRSTHRASADRLAEEWAQTTEGAKRLALAYLLVRDERLNHDVTVLGQPYCGWDMGQLFVLSCLWRLYCLERMAFVNIELGSAPLKDRERIKNQEILDAIGDGVEAKIDMGQRGGEGDGHVEWTRPLDGFIHGKPVSVRPGLATLEIGNTDVSTTCYHLATSGVVARWPYGYNSLSIVTLRPTHLLADMRVGNPPDDDPVIASLVEFLDRMALTRMSRTLQWGVHAPRSSAEERLANATRNFDQE